MTSSRLERSGCKIGSRSHLSALGESRRFDRVPVTSGLLRTTDINRLGCHCIWYRSSCTLRSALSRHEAIEECRERLIAIERKHVRDVLVWPHNHHAASLAIDAAHGEDVVAAPHVGTEDFFVIAKSVTSLPRQQQGRHGLDGKRVMILLEHRADIDHC